MKRLVTSLLALCLVSACGGGGGGSGGNSTSAPSPSITITGNENPFYQDEPVIIEFSASNMDQSTVSWSVSGYNEASFKLDTSRGIFRSVENDNETPNSWLTVPAGNYSHTVTATDGSGKTASRSFQFSVELIPTGYFIAQEPEPAGTAARTLNIDFTRDGGVLIQSFAYEGIELDVAEGTLMTRNLTCFGDAEINGAQLDGTATCGGSISTDLFDSGYYWSDTYEDIYTSMNFVSVGSIAFSIASDEDHDLQGDFTLYSPDGGVLESWTERFLSSQFSGDWSYENTALTGRYVAVSAYSQYQTNLINFPDGRFARDIVWGSLIFDIESDFSISQPSDQTCLISGELTQSTLAEYVSFQSNPQGDYFRNNRARNITANYTASGCSDLILITPEEIVGEAPIDLTQSSGVALVAVFEGGYGIQGLAIAGGGDAQPFRFDVVKACELDGTPVPFLDPELASVCGT